jgi:hypothetical protein
MVKKTAKTKTSGKKDRSEKIPGCQLMVYQYFINNKKNKNQEEKEKKEKKKKKN